MSSVDFIWSGVNSRITVSFYYYFEKTFRTLLRAFHIMRCFYLFLSSFFRRTSAKFLLYALSVCRLPRTQNSNARCIRFSWKPFDEPRIFLTATSLLSLRGVVPNCSMLSLYLKTFVDSRHIFKLSLHKTFVEVE